MNRTRNSRIELLRIVSMLCIIAFHCTRTFDSYFGDTMTPFDKFIEVLFGTWGCLGVHIFVVISAWYLCEQQFKLKKFLGIVFECISYLFIMCALDVIATKGSIVSVFTHFIADVFYRFEGLSGYWFISTYILMYLVSPLLNKLIQYKNFKQILLILSFIPVYCNYYGRGGVICSFTMFSYIYLLTAYIKKINFKFKHPIILSLSIMIVLILLKYKATLPINDFIEHVIYKTIGNYENGSFMITILSYSIFLNCVYKKPYTNRIINYIASFSLGIYCFHEGTRFNVLDNISKYACTNNLINNDNFAYAYILLVLFVFILGILVGSIRRLVLQKPFDYLVDKYISTEKFDNWINSI